MLVEGLSRVVDHPCINHAWIATTMGYVHVHRTHIEDAWMAGHQRAADRLRGLMP